MFINDAIIVLCYLHILVVFLPFISLLFAPLYDEHFELWVLCPDDAIVIVTLIGVNIYFHLVQLKIVLNFLHSLGYTIIVTSVEDVNN